MNSGSILRIDRSVPFNAAKFLGPGWRIWRGPANGDGFTGEEEQDPRSLDLREIDVSQIKLVTTLKAGESFVDGEENLRRLKATKKILLDAQAFQKLWFNQNLIHESWNSKQWISFHGTVLRGPDGNRYVLCLYRDGESWYWSFSWLDNHWDDRGGLSVVLEVT